MPNGTSSRLPSRPRKKARQGVRYHVLEALDVLDPETMEPVPRDGETLGEVMFRGNVVMKGYLKNKSASEKAFAGGWFHSGDLGVMYPDGYIQLKDRSKDIIISGGENISSIEVEDALYKHPAVQAVAVVAKPDEKWGETPCAFVELKPGKTATAEELVAWCKQNLAGYKVPRYHRVRGIAEDLDRQDPEIQVAGSGEGGVSGRGERGVVVARRLIFQTLQRVRQCRQRSRLMMTTGVIHQEAGNGRRPVLQHTNKAALRNILCDLLFICES